MATADGAGAGEQEATERKETTILLGLCYESILGTAMEYHKMSEIRSKQIEMKAKGGGRDQMCYGPQSTRFSLSSTLHRKSAWASGLLLRLRSSSSSSCFWSGV